MTPGKPKFSTAMTERVFLRMNKATAKRLDRLAAKISKTLPEAVNMNRTDMVRQLMAEGLANHAAGTVITPELREYILEQSRKSGLPPSAVLHAAIIDHGRKIGIQTEGESNGD